MKYKNVTISIIVSLSLITCITASAEQTKIHKQVLSNGLTILVKPVQTIQKPSVQLWYNVGSKHEETHEKGLAHLLEHMVFKGTQKLSESDIDAVTQKLSGNNNAMTMWDATMYHFDFPVQHWQEAFPILSDCMSNCTFKTDLLNAEFKAVIQELKKGRDSFGKTLVEKMCAAVFEDHPYHYPIIGFKQDIWNINQQGLMNFYKKHYIPNNAVLVVVGAVEPQEVFNLAEHYFGPIAKNASYKQDTFYSNKDLINKTVTIYRDVQNPWFTAVYAIPGSRSGVLYILSVLDYILTTGKSSRLVKTIVDEKRLANWITSFSLQMFDHDVYFVQFEPKNEDDASLIYDLIQQEFDDLAVSGPKPEELAVAEKNVQVELHSLFESNFQQGYIIGKYYLATGDENYILHFIESDHEKLTQNIKSFASQYLKLSHRHKGGILPMTEQQKSMWEDMQKKSDAEDNQFLASRIRESEIEPISYAHNLTIKCPRHHTLPIPKETMLTNGIKVLAYKRTDIPMITLILDLKAKSNYNPQGLPGLYNILSYMLREGTLFHSTTELAYELESRGITLNINQGIISMTMLNSELPKALELLHEILCCPAFEESALEKVRNWALSDYKHFLDSPGSIVHKLAYDTLFQGHPYSVFALADEQTIQKITRQDLVDFYNKVITPSGALLSIVGDIDEANLGSLLEKKLGIWQGKDVEPITYPTLKPAEPKTITYYMNRDQISLAYAGLSVSGTHPDYHKLSLFGYMLSHGLNSHLYKLREKYGLFYNIFGSLTHNVDKEQPGIVFISTQVSVDQLTQAEELLQQTIGTVIDEVTEEELTEAKNHVLNNTADWYSTNHSVASVFVFLNKYNYPYDYFKTYPDIINAITLDEVKEAARKVLSRDKMITIKVGRI